MSSVLTNRPGAGNPAEAAAPPAPSLATEHAGHSRVAVENITPRVDAGRFPIKRVQGETVTVEADCFADGHDHAWSYAVVGTTQTFGAAALTSGLTTLPARR